MDKEIEVERDELDEENHKTWKDVVALAEKLFEYCKEEMKEKEQEQEEGEPKSQTGDNDLQGDFEQSSGQNENEKSEQENSEKSDSEGTNKSSNDSENGGGDESNESSNSDDDSDSKNDGGGFNNQEPMSLTDKNFRENEDKLNFNDERDKDHWCKTASSSLDLPVIEEEYFYDDWRKVESDIKKWRKRVELNGWGI